MCDPGESGAVRPGDVSRETAVRIAEQVATLLHEARSAKFDFLAYLLGMALKEARRLAVEDQDPQSSG